MMLPAFLHSVSYSGSWGQAALSVERFVEKAAELGYDGVLLAGKRPHVSVLDYCSGTRKKLRDLISDRGLQVAIAGYNNFTADYEHRDIPNYEVQVAYVTELARLTSELGGSLLRVFTSYEHPAAPYTAAWDLTVRALRECSRHAADYGVTVGVQNHHDIAVDYESQFDLIRAVDAANCRALFDAWAPALHGVDLRAAARKMGPVTVHTTIANYQARRRYKYEPAVVNYVEQPAYMQAVPMDKGFIDYRAFLEELCSAGFEGSVAYEMCSPLLGGGTEENLDNYATNFLAFLGGVREGVGAHA